MDHAFGAFVFKAQAAVQGGGGSFSANRGGVVGGFDVGCYGGWLGCVSIAFQVLSLLLFVRFPSSFH